MVDYKEGIRAQVRQLVSSLIPFDNLEREHIGFTQTWIDSGVEIFRLAKPANPPVHLVSYFVVFDQDQNEFLLVDHKNAKLWLPPGGHVEPGEHPQDAVRREMREELGIEADFLFQDPLFLTVTETTGCPESHTDVSLWYVLKGKKGTSFDYDEKEFDQIAWFKESEIPYQRTDPHMQRFIGKLMEELSSFSAYDRLLSF